MEFKTKCFYFSFIFLFAFNTIANAASESNCYDLADTSTLLHMNGTDGSTTFTDVIGKTYTAAGDAQVDTAQSKFGGASALLDGTGDYIYTADDDDFNLGSGDFTIDAWVRLAVATTGVIASQWNRQANQGGWDLQINTTSDVIQFVYTNDGMTVEIKSFAWVETTDTWFHFALVRSGNDLRMFVDGVQVGSTESLSGETIFDSNAEFRIGNLIDSGGNNANQLNGWVDELRVVKGTGIWTSNFSTSSNEYSECSSGATFQGVSGTLYAY